jgi:hypothetical protein
MFPKNQDLNYLLKLKEFNINKYLNKEIHLTMNSKYPDTILDKFHYKPIFLILFHAQKKYF